MWHQVSGGSRGRAWSGLPLFLDQTEAWRTDKKFFETSPPPLSQGLDDCPPLISGSGWLPPPPLSEGLDLPLLVTMVAKFLELNNLSWQRQPFANMSNDGKKSWATIWFLSAIVHLTQVTSRVWWEAEELNYETDDCWSEHTKNNKRCSINLILMQSWCTLNYLPYSCSFSGRVEKWRGKPKGVKHRTALCWRPVKLK